MTCGQSEYYIFRNKDGEYLCRYKNKLYFSTEEVDRVITYRNEKHAQNFLKDRAYLKYRKIKPKDLTLVKGKFLILLLPEYIGK